MTDWFSLHFSKNLLAIVDVFLGVSWTITVLLKLKKYRKIIRFKFFFPWLINPLKRHKTKQSSTHETKSLYFCFRSILNDSSYFKVALFKVFEKLRWTNYAILLTIQNAKRDSQNSKKLNNHTNTKKAWKDCFGIRSL